MDASAISQPDDRTQEMQSSCYTDAPLLHPNLFLGSLQLLSWLLFHPTAWRQHVRRIDPALAPDFALGNLTWAQWRQPAVRRLIIQSFGLWVCLLNLALFILAGSTQSTPANTAYITASMTVCVLLLGGVLNIQIFAVGMPVGYLAIGIALAIQTSFAFSISSIAIGVAGSVMLSLIGQRTEHSALRQGGAILIGMLVGGIAALVVPGVLLLADELAQSLGRGGLLTIGVGLTLGAAIAARRRSWRAGLGGGVLLGGMVGAIDLAIIDVVGATPHDPAGAALSGVAGGIVYAAWLGSSTLLADRLTKHLAGPWAGTLAGTMGLSAAFLLTLAIDPIEGSWLSLNISLIAVALGLTIAWWRPLLLYPLLGAWNLLLYRADERRGARSPCWLRWHAAFWDEHQWLPLYGLDEHLLLVLERNPAEGQRALDNVARGRQRWAAQAVQIELDARLLEHCPTVAAVSTVAAQLVVGDLTGPANALLRSFSRISQDVAAALQFVNTYHQRLALRAIEDQLDGLLRELTRSSEPYAQRFRPIATHWHRLIAEQHRTLALTAEQRQEIDNPYVVGVPLSAQQAIFVGRTEISRQIEMLLLDRQCPPLLLYGQRRIGKTSLLNNLGRLLPHDIVPLFIDMQGPVALAATHAGLLAALARAMRLAAQQERAISLPPLPYAELEADPFPRFDAWLDAVEQVLAHRAALLMLDEFEVLESFLAEGSFDERAVLGMLRHTIQHRPRLKILLAGSHTLDEVQRWASYLINVQVIPISYLSAEETRQLVEHPIQDFALRYTPEASTAVFALTRGHPALVQLLCTAIVEGKNRQPPEQRRYVCRADVEAVIPEALQRGSFFFADIERNQTDAQGRALLRALGRYGQAAVVPMATLSQLIPEGDAQVVANLLRRELIESVDGGYRFKVELIRRWFLLN